MRDKAILYDSTLCTACRACQVACKQWNENQAVKTTNQGSYENPPALTPETWLKIEFREVERGGRLAWLFSRRACMHCTDAACVKVCPTGALRHHELGFVTYDKDLFTAKFLYTYRNFWVFYIKRQPCPELICQLRRG